MVSALEAKTSKTIRTHMMPKLSRTETNNFVCLPSSTFHRMAIGNKAKTKSLRAPTIE